MRYKLKYIEIISYICLWFFKNLRTLYIPMSIIDCWCGD